MAEHVYPQALITIRYNVSDMCSYRFLSFSSTSDSLVFARAHHLQTARLTIQLDSSLVSNLGCSCGWQLCVPSDGYIPPPTSSVVV